MRLLAEDLVGWDEYAFDTLNPPEPGFFTLKRFSHLAEVTVNGENRFEAWGSVAVPEQGTALPSPCASITTYTTNTEMWATAGRRIAWYRFDPATGVDLASEKYITSSERELPTSYPRSDQLVVRGELGDEEFLYVGTQDQIVCDELVEQNSAGTSVRFIKLNYKAAADNYEEVELGYLLDISNPTSPNWICADADVRCAGVLRAHYGKVSAVPFRSGNRMQLYVSAWGSAAPTLPAIGEAGVTAASHQTTRVLLLPLTGLSLSAVVDCDLMSRVV